MKRYVAKSGDYLVKVAEEHGTTWQAIWNHPENAEHRAKHSGPDSLWPGDVLMIPVPATPSTPPHSIPPSTPLPSAPPEPPEPPLLPVGVMRPYVIRQGDYVDKLAFSHGFDAIATWNAPENAALRQQRRLPDILHPGDILYIPLLPSAPKPLAARTSNHFVASTPATTLHIQLEQDGAPLANEPYELVGLPPPHDAAGVSDGDGSVTVTAPVHAPSFEIHFTNLGAVYPVRVGEMDPVEENAGVIKRLRALGYAYVPPREQLDEWLDADAATVRRHELLNYQQKRGLSPTGVLDVATRDTLVKDYGC